MDWQTIGSTVAKIAPVLGGILGGPVGAVASAAGSLLASALGVEPSPEAVKVALSDQESIIKLKELEIQHKARLLEWQGMQLQAELENTKDARAKEIALAKAGSKAAWATPFVALVVSVGFFVLLWQVLKLQTEVPQAALLLLGTLSTGFGSVINYYLGSSLGSSQKNDLVKTYSTIKK